MSSAMPFPPAPRDRSGFQVAIFCALPLEVENVLSVFDICWEDQDKKYGTAPGDQNAYNTGVIGKYNVVLVYMPSMGGNSATLAAAGLRSSFRGIQLALVVGICGVVPVHPVTEQEIVLGDIIVSTAVVQYDFGRQFPGGFKRKKAVEDSLGRANPEIRMFTNKLITRQNRQRFSIKLQQLVQSEDFQTKVPVAHPGAACDHLYEASYLHRHQSDTTCDKCLVDVGTCSRTCDELDCEEGKLVARHRLNLEGGGQSAESTHHLPLVHVGRFGSVNMVMKSGLDRDRLSAADKLTAFEMEGLGLWEQYPTIVIKAACDYADGHKDKGWQKYAAAIAAGGLKIFLKEWIILEPLSERDDTFTPAWHVPFGPMPGFIGREDEFRQLEKKLFTAGSARIAALLGLGGVGKSRLALEFAFRIKSRSPTYMVLWVQASEQSTFNNDMLEIGIKLGIPGIKDKTQDVRALVKQWLSNSKRQWFLILDNADDTVLWGKGLTHDSTQTSLADFLPRRTTGSILVTTRSRQVADYLAQAESIQLLPPPADQACEMFITRLQNPDLAADQDALLALLDQLAYLPLALVQAASFINKTQRPVRTYLDLMSKAEESILKLLSQDFGDRSRYPNAINPVVTTWFTTFTHIRAHSSLAATLLCRIVCFHEQRIPQSLLQDDDPKLDDFDFINAITVLSEYSLVTVTSSSSPGTEEVYNIHRLVRLAVRNWLQLEGTTMSLYIRASIARLAQLFPVPNYEHKDIWAIYLPHALRVCEEDGGEDIPERYDLLEKVALCFMIDGRYNEAVDALTKAVKWRERSAVSDRCMFDVYNNLGKALRLRGEWPRAKAYLRQAYSWRKEKLGTEHPSTLTSMDNLAGVLRDQGKYNEAEEMHRQVVEVRERVLGKEHPDTLTSMDNLAGVLRDQGKYNEAEEMHRQVVEVRERVLGKEHPNTLTSINNLARVLRDQGKYSEAESMHRQVLEVRERILGREHPATLTSIDNLAIVLRDQGKHSEAESIHRQVLKVRERVLGEKHPDTIESMVSLAVVYRSQGQSSKAEQIDRDVLELQRVVPDDKVQRIEIDEHSDISDISDVSDVSEIESVTSMGTDLTSEPVKYVSDAEKHLVTLFCKDATLSSAYQAAIKKFNREKFFKNHDRLLKTFFKDLRIETLKTKEVIMVRYLRRADRRNKITTLLQQMFWTSISDRQKAMDILKDQKPDHKLLLTRTMDSEDLGSSQNVEQVNDEDNPLVNEDIDDKQDDVYSTSSSSSSGDDMDGDDHVEVEDTREVIDAIEDLEIFIRGSHAFASFKAQLNYLLVPPSNLAEALASHDLLVIQRFLTRNFSTITSASYEWLHELHAAGYTKRELSELLLEDSIDSPWIYFSPQAVSIHTLRLECHVPGCAHGELNGRSSSLTLDPKFQTASHDRAHLRRQVEELCGIAGIAPNSRDTSEWHGAVMFQDNMTASRITYAAESAQRSRDEQWTRLSAILTRLIAAAAMIQTAGLCCNSFTFIHCLTDHLELYRLPFRLVKELDDLLKVVTQEGDTTEAVQQCAQQAKKILRYFQEACISTAADDEFDICALAVQFVCLAFLSYLQAHAGPIKPFFLDTPQRKLLLLGNQDFTAQSGIEARLVGMACLSGVTRDHVIAFSAIRATVPEIDLGTDTPRYHVSATAEDLLDTWGPGHLIYNGADHTSISAIAIGGGIISSPQSAPSMFHWTTGLTPPGSCARFSSTTKILVGAILDINTRCDIDRILSRNSSSCALENLSTYGPFWNLQQRQGGFQGGQYVNATFIQVWNKVPGRTLKEYALEQSVENTIHLLDQNWGLQVSFCTSVACRVPLRQLIADLLPEFVSSLDNDSWQELTSVYGIIDAFRHGDIYEWLRRLPDQHRPYVLKMVKQILEQLRHTGLDRQSNTLKVAWPLKGDFRGLKIPCATQTYWASILDDADDCATFAYITTKCLETSLVRCQGGLRAWQNVSKMLITEVSQYRSEGYPAVIANAGCVVNPGSVAMSTIGTTAAAAAAAAATTTMTITATVNPATALNEWRLRNQETYFIKKFDLLLRGKVERSATDTPHLVIEKSKIPQKIWDRLVAKQGTRRNHYIREKQMTGDHSEWVVVRSSFS